MQELAVWNRWRRIIGAVVCALGLYGLGGCSAMRLGYTQGPTLGGWWLDGYFDFSSTQEPAVQQALADWFGWHRTTQLPEYAEDLGRMRQQLAQPELQAAQVCQWSQRWEQHLQVSLNQALPAMARIAQTLSPAQLQHFQKKQEARNARFLREDVQASPAERRDKRLEDWRERYEDLYGDLNPAQLTVLEAAAERIAPDAQQREREHLARQRDTLRLLNTLATQPPGQEAAQQALATQLRPMLVWDGWGSPAWRNARRQQRQAHCEVLARMHQLSTPAQREHAQQWLSGWEHDLRQLGRQLGRLGASSRQADADIVRFGAHAREVAHGG
jgi:hypothetical protein